MKKNIEGTLMIQNIVEQFKYIKILYTTSNIKKTSSVFKMILKQLEIFYFFSSISFLFYSFYFWNFKM